jgi:hypothetical protein
MITKNITNLLERGNLTAKERFLLLVHNDLARAKTGKNILTEADKFTLEHWTVKTNEEAREWNQLNEGWQLSGRMNIEAELHFKDAQVAYLSQLPVLMNLLMYPADRRAAFSVDALKRIKKVTIDEAVAITQKQKEAKLKEGMDFDYAVYELAFELLAPDDRKRMKELYDDIEYDHQYLDQEEIIANLYGGKNEMSDKAKDTLADLVAEKSYNGFAKEYQLFHYFACIPLLEVARHFLKAHGVEISGKPMAKDQQADDEDDITHEAVTKAMQAYAESHGTTIKAMLREGCRRWLDTGLLDDYTPLVASDDADLLARWFGAKAMARKKLLEHVAAGDLVFRDRTDEETRKEKLWSKGLYGREFTEAQIVLEDLHLEPVVKGELDEKRAFATFSDKVITGESLYTFKGNYAFIQDFKKRADIYDANLGLVYAENDPEHKGDHLDQELLICDLTENGEAAGFSRYGMSVAMLSGLLRSQTLFEDFTKDGKLFLKFKDDRLAESFAVRRQGLIDGYAILLGFETVFKKLSSVYETDMAEHVTQRLAALRQDIKQHNEAVRIGTNTDEATQKSGKRFLREEPMSFETEMTIDVEAIKPDEKTIEEHETKLKEIFPQL